MKKYLIKICTFICLIAISIPSFAKDYSNSDVHAGNGNRQDVIQRTYQYSRGVDLVGIGREVEANWSRPRDWSEDKSKHVFGPTGGGEAPSGGISGGSLEGSKKNCKGFTMSACGLPCCGQTECSLVCKKNNTIAHGDEMCLSPYKTSKCGMSCCGKEDCEKVCVNYRIEGDCGGYTKTQSGLDCCGYEDCRKKECGSYTSVIDVNGKKKTCCGKENCEKVKCEYQIKTSGSNGGVAGLECCGNTDCALKECGGYTSTVSISDKNKKELRCCGKQNCYEVSCDGYTSVSSPEGVVECCGYSDCHQKECQNIFYTVLENGQKVACCGQKYCTYLQRCYASGQIAQCIMRFEDAKDGVVAGLVNEEVGNAYLYIGIVGNDYWGGWCTIYEHWTRMRVLQPKAIKKVTLEYAKWDDYMQVWMGQDNIGKMDLVWSGPNENFPPETEGACELSTSWAKNPNVDVTKYFRDVKEGSLVSFKTRVSVAGKGEGYARLRIEYEVPGAF